MKIKLLSSVLLTFLLTTFIFSQNLSQSLNERKEERKIYLYSSLGILDFISLGIGYQATENFAISIKGSQTFITGASMGFPNAGYGLGSKVSYSTKFLLFNSISAEHIVYLGTTTDDSKSLKYAGNYFDLNIGRENIYEEGFNVFWAIGICLSAVKSRDILLSPSLKVGLNYNFN